MAHEFAYVNGKILPVEEAVMPGCQASNPPTNKFCHKCGAPLIQAPSATKFAAPDPYTSNTSPRRS